MASNRRGLNRVPGFEETFSKVVPEYFAFLSTEYGFIFTQENACHFRAQTVACIVHIYLDWGGTAVSIQPSQAQYACNRQGCSHEIGLSTLLSCMKLGEEKDIASSSIKTHEELFAELRKQSHLLRESCASLLAGDFSQWQRLEVCAHKKLEALHSALSKYADQGRRTELAEIRSRAETTFQARDYQNAVTFYESIQQSLTPGEIRKLAFAKRQITGK